MVFKTNRVFFIFLLYCHTSYTMDIQEYGSNILHFIDYDKNADEITFKKNSIPLFQEMLETTQKENSFFLKEHLITLIGFGAIALNFFFLCKLYDTTQKNIEEQEQIDIRIDALVESTKMLQEAHERQKEDTKVQYDDIKQQIEEMAKKIYDNNKMIVMSANVYNEEMHKFKKTFNRILEHTGNRSFISY